MLEDAFRKCVQGILGTGSLAGDCTRSNSRLAEAIETAGYLDLLVPPENGGAGLGLTSLYEIARICGELLVPLPVAQTILARGWASRNAFKLQSGVWIALAGETVPIPHADYATHMLDICGGDLRIRSVVDPGTDVWMAGSSCRPHLGETLCTWPGQGVSVEVAGAALCGAWIAGGLHAVTRQSITHVTGRIQFGRPLAAFQAIQQMMARLVEQAASAEAASRLAFRGSGFDPICSGIAKVRAGEAAGQASALAHQVHGALGMTDDYPLSRLTRHLAVWRQAWGGEGHWSQQLGKWIADPAAGSMAGRLIDLA